MKTIEALNRREANFIDTVLYDRPSILREGDVFHIQMFYGVSLNRWNRKIMVVK